MIVKVTKLRREREKSFPSHLYEDQDYWKKINVMIQSAEGLFKKITKKEKYLMVKEKPSTKK